MDFWCAIAHTKWGDIQGKSNKGLCWYTYEGKEHWSFKFSYYHGQILLKASDGPPVSRQNETSDFYWFAVTNTKWGRIPGFANKDEMQFTYFGK